MEQRWFRYTRLSICIFVFDGSLFTYFRGTAKIDSLACVDFSSGQFPNAPSIGRRHDIAAMGLADADRTTGSTLERSAKYFWRVCFRPW